MNNYQLMVYEGHMTADPEMRYTPSGRSVTNFTIGSNKSYKKGDEWQEQVTWLRCVAWGNLGEYVNNSCAKGARVIVQGTLRPNKEGNPEVYEMKNGEHGASYEFTVERITVIDGKKAKEDAVEQSIENDEIPF